MSLCEKCAARDLKAMRALESLTPSGSEFVNEVERCLAFAKMQRDHYWQAILRLIKERNALRKQLEDQNV